VERDDLQIVELLLQQGADVNLPAARIKGSIAFQAATEMGNFQLVQDFLERGADINCPAADVEGKTALQAATAGQTRVPSAKEVSRLRTENLVHVSLAF